MQPTTSGSSSSSGGGSRGELNRAGLARFRSAPATWLETLLEEEEGEEDEDDPLKRNECLTELLIGNSGTPTNSGRRNSGAFHSPADPGLFESGSTGFLGNSGIGSDGYFSNFQIPASFDCLSPNLDGSPAGKLSREVESLQPSHMKQEQGSLLAGGVSGLIDREMERLLEDSVPCRVRAKRGCATHPRSIAERVRRTRISDRIRKLQELVPNMDKQTNTADMLEEAVEYVKFLQRQIQELSEHQKKCKCISTD